MTATSCVPASSSVTSSVGTRVAPDSRSRSAIEPPTVTRTRSVAARSQVRVAPDEHQSGLEVRVAVTGRSYGDRHRDRRLIERPTPVGTDSPTPRSTCEDSAVHGDRRVSSSSSTASSSASPSTVTTSARRRRSRSRSRGRGPGGRGDRQAGDWRSVKTGMVTRAVVGDTSTGLTASPSWSTGTSRTSWSMSMPPGWMATSARAEDHLLDDRRRARHLDLGRVDGRVPDVQAVGRRAALDDDRHGPRLERVELDRHDVGRAAEDRDARIERGHDDREELGTATGRDVGQVDGRGEGRGDRADTSPLPWPRRRAAEMTAGRYRANGTAPASTAGRTGAVRCSRGRSAKTRCDGSASSAISAAAPASRRLVTAVPVKYTIGMAARPNSTDGSRSVHGSSPSAATDRCQGPNTGDGRCYTGKCVTMSVSGWRTESSSVTASSVPQSGPESIKAERGADDHQDGQERDLGGATGESVCTVGAG